MEKTMDNPKGSTYTTIRELGPKIPYYRRNYGSQFPNGCICGPSRNEMETELPDGLMGIQASRLPHLGGVLFWGLGFRV